MQSCYLRTKVDERPLHFAKTASLDCLQQATQNVTHSHCIQRPSKRHLGLFCAPVSVNTRKSMTKPWGFTYEGHKNSPIFREYTTLAELRFFFTVHSTSPVVQIGYKSRPASRTFKELSRLPLCCLEQLNACMHAAQCARYDSNWNSDCRKQSFIGSHTRAKILNLSKNSHIENITFQNIHILKISFFFT